MAHPSNPEQSTGPALPTRALERHVRSLLEASISQDEPLPGNCWLVSEDLSAALKVISQASDLVKDTSTKYSLVLGSSASLSGPAVESIAAEMRNACDQLNVALSLLRHPTAGACGHLVELYAQQSRTILRAVEDLVKASQGADRQEKTLAPKTGVVWSACEQLTRLPKSNKVAYRRALLQHQHALNDTTKEFTDILAQEEGETDEEEEDQGLADAMGDLDLMDDDFFGEAKALKGWEKRNVERAMQVLDLCGQIFRNVLSEVDARMDGGKGAEGQEAAQEAMKEVAGVESACAELSAAVVNAADALYPPQMAEEMESTFQEVLRCVQCLASLPIGREEACIRRVEEIEKEIAKGFVQASGDSEEAETEPTSSN